MRLPRHRTGARAALAAAALPCPAASQGCAQPPDAALRIPPHPVAVRRRRQTSAVPFLAPAKTLLVFKAQPPALPPALGGGGGSRYPADSAAADGQRAARIAVHTQRGRLPASGGPVQPRWAKAAILARSSMGPVMGNLAGRRGEETRAG